MDALLEFFGNIVARFALPVLTFGKIRVVPLSSQNQRTGYSVSRSADGKIEISSDLASILGLLATVALIAVALLIYAFMR